MVSFPYTHAKPNLGTGPKLLASMASSNPFASLFPSEEALQEPQDAVKRQKIELGSTLMRVFLFTAADSGS